MKQSRTKQGKLPLLTPMSEVAGRFSIQAAATALQIANGGKGCCLGGVPGVSPAKLWSFWGRDGGYSGSADGFRFGSRYHYY